MLCLFICVGKKRKEKKKKKVGRPKSGSIIVSAIALLLLFPPLLRLGNQTQLPQRLLSPFFFSPVNRPIPWKDRHPLKLDDLRSPDSATSPQVSSSSPMPILRKANDVDHGSESDISISGQKVSMSPVSQEVMHNSPVSVMKSNSPFAVSEDETRPLPRHTRDQLHRRTHASSKKMTNR